MASIAILGAGIAGLTAAFRLDRAGVDVTVFEAANHAGGVIRSERTEGFLVEHGPNSIQAKTPGIHRLVRELELGGACVEASTEARHRFVVRRGRPVALPLTPAALLGSRLVSWSAKLRLLCEPFVDPAPADVEESVADFVRRRLGAEWLEYAVNPFVAGVFAGDPERLSLPYAFPKLHASEQEHGSLIRAQLDRKRSAGRSPGPSRSRRMISFREGLQTLPDALSARLDGRIRTGSPVTGLRRVSDGWAVTVRHGTDARVEVFRKVVSTLPLHRLASLDLRVQEDTTPLTRVAYPPIRVVALGYRREDVAHPLDGFGLLVPAAESSFRILGTLFSSTLFPGRAPEGHVLLTTFLGGTRRPALAGIADDEAEALVASDLARLLGIRGAPVFARQVHWPHAIPQYELGFGAVHACLAQLERAHPDLVFAGNYRSGVAVGDALDSGERAAERMLNRGF